MTQEEKLRKPEEIKKRLNDTFEMISASADRNEKAEATVNPSSKKEQLQKGENK